MDERDVRRDGPRVRWGWILFGFLAVVAMFVIAVILFVVLTVKNFDLDGGVV